jgi:large subunit ribosomal protein L15
MNLSTLRAPRKAAEKRKRVGRGMGSGMGKTSTRGHKGQRSRSGSRMMRGFEGGQMPLHRRLPKRGFTNIFRSEYCVINLDKLAGLREKEITPDVLVKAGLAGKNDRIKILGDGELKSAVTVRAHKFSQSAQEKISKAGGKTEIIVNGTPEGAAKAERAVASAKAEDTNNSPKRERTPKKKVEEKKA